MTPIVHPFSRLLRRVLVPTLAALGSAALTHGQTALVAKSPFAPSGAAAAGAAAASAEAYQLAGATVQGSETSVCIYVQQTKRSEWIPVGGESEGVKVVSYDGDHDTAVITVSGSRKEISMRKAVVASAGQFAPGAPGEPRERPRPRPAGRPAPPGAPQSPEKVVQEQREARMLVSDLLEIGVQQRKAFQEAKQKAAAGAQAQPQN